MTIRVMTWNVHGTFNLNPRFDADAVAAVIAEWAPDLVGLQEIDSRGRKDDPFRRLASLVGGHNFDARSIVTRDGDYGQVLLSRWPFVREPTVIDVSYREREPRRAIAACVQAPVGEVTVIATHLGLSMRERTRQARAIVNLVESPRAIVLGDFNDWFWVSSVRRILARRCPVHTSFRTFPSWCPILRLDQIYATAAGVIVAAQTDRSARKCSDHLPVIADIDFPMGASPAPEPSA